MMDGGDSKQPGNSEGRVLETGESLCACRCANMAGIMLDVSSEIMCRISRDNCFPPLLADGEQLGLLGRFICLIILG
jgi:hypothetical protein